jgi:hypothetical protein
MINECFYHFKHLYNDLLKKVDSGGKNNPNPLKEGMQMDSNKQTKEQNANSNAANQQNNEEVKRLVII